MHFKILPITEHSKQLLANFKQYNLCLVLSLSCHIHTHTQSHTHTSKQTRTHTDTKAHTISGVIPEAGAGRVKTGTVLLHNHARHWTTGRKHVRQWYVTWSELFLIQFKVDS